MPISNPSKVKLHFSPGGGGGPDEFVLRIPLPGGKTAVIHVPEWMSEEDFEYLRGTVGDLKYTFAQRISAPL